MLIDIRFIEHSHVNNNLARLRARGRLETNTQPAVRFVMFLETSRRYRVGKDEERAFIPKFFFETLQQEIVLVVEHRVQPDSTYVAIGWSVNRVAESHVVSRHRLGNCAGRAADMKKTARYFLARADLGESAVLLPIEIDLERLPVRSDIHLCLHANTVAAVYDRRKKGGIFYIRTCSALFAGIQPCKLFGSAA